jgi:hypothetical protein
MKPLLLLLCGSAAFGQTSGLVGLVTDASGAAVPQAFISLLNQNTGLRRSARTDARGVYVVDSLPAATYRVVAAMPGFQTEVRVGVRIEDGRDHRLDFRLRIGDRWEAVTVSSTPDLRGPDDASLGTIVSGSTANELPLNGRGFLGLLELQPGVLTTPVRPEDQGQFSANGQRAGANFVTVDGISANFNVSGATQAWAGGLPALSAMGSMQPVAQMESIAEARITTADASAASARTAGAQLALTTQSGGNQFHGGVAYDFRNGALDANDWFRNRSGLSRAPTNSDQLSATAGGPIRRDRTFFFAGFEYLRLHAPTTITTGVPDPGTFHADDPLVEGLVNLYRPPNGPSIGGGLAWRTAAEEHASGVRSGAVRLDHSFAEGRNAFLRWQHAPSDETEDSSYAYATAARQLRHDQAVAALTLTFGGTAVADVRAGLAWARIETQQTLNAPAGGQPDFAAYAPELPTVPAGAYEVGLIGAGSIHSGTQDIVGQDQANVIGSLSLVRGRHSWKAGAEYRRTATGIGGPPAAVTALYENIDSLRNGSIYSLTISRQSAMRMAATQISAFAQDRYAITPRLTLHYGLRLEFEPPLGAGVDVAFATARDTRTWSDLRLARGESFWNPRYPQFAPRAGFAYRLTQGGDWVLRAGGGLYYGFAAAAVAPGAQNQPPYSSARLYLLVKRTDDERTIVPPSLALTPPYTNIGGFDRQLEAPRTWQWNVQLERSLGRDAVFQGAWVGARGLSLLRREVVISPAPNFASLDFATSHGDSLYHALQIQVRRKAAGPLLWSVGYTWSHSLDNGSRDAEATLPEARLLDWGRSSFDARHQFHAAFTWEPRRLRGWGLDGIFGLRTGLPVAVNSGFGAQGSGAFVLLRPDLNFGAPLWLPDAAAPGGRRMNPAAFSPTDGSRQGTLGRNVVGGFMFAQFDMSVHRAFQLRRSELQFRLDAYNVTNRPNFANPQDAILVSAPNFGQSLSLLNGGLTSDLFGLDALGGPSLGLSPLLQIGGPRVLQLSIRLRF